MRDLSRFTEAQQRDYEKALSEIKAGRKRSHWMWYIFPQIAGLGESPTSQYYSIRNLEEAREYINDPYLGGNLIEISNALLELDTDDASYVLGYPDDMKLKSCMTLFRVVSDDPVFDKVLGKYYGGKPDWCTLDLI